MSIKFRAKSVLNFITDKGNSITIGYGKEATVRSLVTDCLNLFLKSEGINAVTAVVTNVMSQQGFYRASDSRWSDRSWLETINSDVAVDSILMSMHESLFVIDNLSTSKRLNVASETLKLKIEKSIRDTLKQHVVEVLIHE